jgi:hypothetical protein
VGLHPPVAFIHKVVIAVRSETLEQGHYMMQRKPESEIAT